MLLVCFFREAPNSGFYFLVDERLRITGFNKIQGLSIAFIKIKYLFKFFYAAVLKL